MNRIAKLMALTPGLWACVAVAGTGTSNEFRVDTRTGVRTAAATEKIQYSTAWLEGQDLRGGGDKLDGYRRFVVISMEGYTGSSLSWARVLVRISTDIPGFDYDDMAYPQTGGDLIFTDYDEAAVYDHDIDEWNVNGESLVWVKIPTLTPGLKIKMGYGKSGATMNANAANTWKGYAGVWHMGSEGALEKDATSNGLNATPYGTGATLRSRDQGVCGKAQVTGVETPNYDSLALGGVFTASGWFRADAEVTSWDKLFYRNDSSWADGGWGVECAKSSTDLTVVGSSNTSTYKPAIPTLLNQWVYCSFVYNGTTVQMYANGALIGSGTIVAAKDNGKKLKISRDGLICDEVRLCKGAFSATQIKFDYDTVNNKNFCTFSPSYRIADNPKVEIAANGLKLFEGTGAGCYDWTPTRGGLYEFEHLTCDGEATVLDKLTATFQVPDQPISPDEVTVEAYSGTYDGKGHGLGVSGPEGVVFRFATVQGGPFVETLLFTNVCDVTVWYEVSGEGYLSLTNSSTVKITPKSIEGATVILGDPLAYTGEEQRQTISQVTVDGLDVTYTVEGDSATERGEHTMTLTGTGNFEGTVEKTYAIQDVAVSARQRYPWNGLVDLKFTVTGAAGTTFDVAFTATDEIGGTNVPMKTLIREDGSAASSTAAVSPGTYRWAWNAAADLPKGWTCRGVSISADANVRTYTVRFNANGGSGTMQDEKFTYGIAQPLTANTFMRNGYIFDGWAKSPTGIKVYSDKQSVSNLTATANAVCNLYARWKEVPTSLYLVIDLSGGPSAKSYAKTSLDAVPSEGWKDDYRKTKLVLRRIEPGTFVHNDTFGGQKGTIKLTSPYYIGIFEVTQRQYELVMGENPSYYSGDMRPVESVSWTDLRGDATVYNWPGETKVDASTFIGKIRAKTGLDFDLPTEAEWENACRAGTTTEYCCGSSGDELMKYARHSFNRDDGKGVYSEHTKVGSYLSNAWGLYDMHGNVRELCVNWSYAVADATDPIGPLTGTYKVICNGDYSSGLTEMGSSFSASGLPDRRSAGTGFRLSLPLR